jgi:acetylornithine deacetylase/succinyl-diaminopimelate desuccinylase-like protein
MQTPNLANVLSLLDTRRDAAVTSLIEFLKIPSVSTKPQHAPDMSRCADWLCRQLAAAKLDARVLPTAGHPIVLATNRHQSGRPTVLLYGHYDVQPPEPLDLWTSPPFAPAIRDGALFARGASDDKGQVWAHVQAIAAWQDSGGLPVNLTLLIEGEEEIGSDHLPPFVGEHRDVLKADIALVSDTNQFARGIPAVCVGLRGLVYMEVSITGPGHDVHSGLWGGAVPNPANILCELLATLHDASGKVNIPGFYDNIIDPTPRERQQWADLPFDDAATAGSMKLKTLTGEPGYTNIERTWSRPTCDINGLTSGYQGPGAKTIIPSTASAKVSMRLVPGQDPQRIIERFETALRSRCPSTVHIDITRHSHTPAVLVPVDSPAMKLAAQAVEIGFGKSPTFIRGGGSIPVVALFKSLLNIDTLLVGFGLPDDRVHSPNEKFDLDSFHGGTRTAAALYDRLAALTSG